jgi:hypothetical protein
MDPTGVEQADWEKMEVPGVTGDRLSLSESESSVTIDMTEEEPDRFRFIGVEVAFELTVTPDMSTPAVERRWLMSSRSRSKDSS